MLKLFIQIFCILGFICVINGGPPTFITKCKASDSKCIKETTREVIPIFASGIPEYGVESMDPMSVKSINASESNLIFVINDVTVTGLRNCEPKKVERDVKRSKISLKIICSAKLVGDYTLKGSVLFVPIEGNGKMEVNLKSTLFDIVFDMVDKINNDGNKYWAVKTWQHTFEIKDKSDVHFENLYNGNEVLGRAARELVTNHGNEIIKEIGSPVIKHVIAKIVKNINHFFKKTTDADLSLD